MTSYVYFSFFKTTATTEIYTYLHTLSLHDALPISPDPAYNAELPHPGTSNAPYRVYNLGNDQPVQLLRFIELLEQNLGRSVEKRLLPMQPGDVPDTWADVSALRRDVGYAPRTSIDRKSTRLNSSP